MTAPQPPIPAERLDSFPADYARHGLDYGADLYPDAQVGIDMGRCVGVVNGFYQMALHRDRLYACFGGFLRWDTLERVPVPGITPGMLVCLDADTLQRVRVVALPYRPNALALRADGAEAATTHTHAQTVSVVDLGSGEVRCWKPDTAIDGREYRSRYIAYAPDGQLIANYYRFSFDPDERDTVAMKFDRTLARVPGFRIAPFERTWAMPLLWSEVHGGRFVVGSRAPRLLDAGSGEVAALGPALPGANHRNYCHGPDGTLFASQDAGFGRPNLAWLDPASGHGSWLTTGAGAVELAYDAGAGWLLACNYDSRTLSIVQPRPGARTFDGARFVNVVFDGHPSSLALRRTATHLEVFVGPKWTRRDGRHRDLLARLRIPRAVRDVAQLLAPGACSVQEFDMYDGTVSAPRAARVLDMARSRARLRADAREALAQARRRLPEAEARLAALRREAAGGAADPALRARIDKTGYGVRWWRQRIATLEAALSAQPDAPGAPPAQEGHA
ncbi:hypothetical protein [Luteimonas huabeiensis]|uniref:hypothetical protein n=1 Tax=Luteimonas huabeiensis TaxID=1244513 RepID=UPI000463AB4C|nr:hypothetical protein [Luteimonas huabeiensis]